jgi:hypothetical protein
MEGEKRKHERAESDLMASLVFDSREVSVNVGNLSAGGAFVQVRRDDNDKITLKDVGQSVLLRMKQYGSLVTKYGQICRCIEGSGSKSVAIMFTPRAW